MAPHPRGGPAARDAGTQRPAPVFILAPARSCSTVALAVLAGHPGVFGFPELLLFSFPTVADLLDEGRDRPDLPDSWIEVRLSGVLRVIADLHEGVQDEAAIGRARGWLRERSGWPTTRLLDHLLDLVSPRIGLEKSPDTVLHDWTLARCVRSHPAARFIHLTRHPVTTQRSMHEHWRQLVPDEIERRRVAASAWYSAHRRIVGTLERLPADRWIRVRAEDLLRDPRAVLPPILDRLALDHGEDVISGMLRPERWRYAGTGTGDRLFGGDAKFLRAPGLRAVADPGPVVFDRTWKLPAAARKRMTRLAAYLGYPPGDGPVDD